MTLAKICEQACCFLQGKWRDGIDELQAGGAEKAFGALGEIAPGRSVGFLDLAGEAVGHGDRCFVNLFFGAPVRALEVSAQESERRIARQAEGAFSRRFQLLADERVAGDQHKRFR